jgi:phosphoenolpyruvate synthase/pyruvate phosphate dikinase
LGKRLAEVGHFVEKALQKPQDIEGAVVNNRIFLVQARPQRDCRPGKTYEQIGSIQSG